METTGDISLTPNLPAPTPAELAADSPAAFEQTAFALGVDLEHQRAKNDLNKLLREDNLEVHVHRIMKVFLWVAFGLSLSGIVIFAYHEMMPKRLTFSRSGWVFAEQCAVISGERPL